MGSRTRGNLGGSGKPTTRIDWAVSKKFIKQPQKNVPFDNEHDLNIYLDDDKIYCLECGDSFKSLGHHLSRTHSMSSRDYKIKYNIPVTRSLSGNSLRRVKAEIGFDIVKKNPQIAESGRKNLNKFLGKQPRTNSNIREKQYTKKCTNCGSKFTRKRNKYKFCSQECNFEHKKRTGYMSIIGTSGGNKRKEGLRDDLGRFKK